MEVAGRKYGDGNGYEDIIDLPHHVSASHPQMSRMNRAAQFSPFAALTGYHEAIEETGRRTDGRMELDEDVKEVIDGKLRMIQEQITMHPEVAVTYFLPDEKKDGGCYVTVRGCVKKIDRYGQTVVLQDGTRIPVEEILGIEGECLGWNKW